MRNKPQRKGDEQGEIRKILGFPIAKDGANKTTCPPQDLAIMKSQKR